MQHLHLLVLIMAAGVGAQWLAARYHLPALPLLLLTGLLLGPVSASLLGPGGRILAPEHLFGELLDPIIKLAVAIVLFEGGLSLHLREARHVGSTLFKLILADLILGFGLVMLLGIFVAGLSAGTAAVLGAILVVTGPTVIVPMLRTARIALRPAALLKWEGIVNDPLGALLAILALNVAALMQSGSHGFLAVISWLLATALISALLGAALGWMLARALEAGAIAEHVKSPVILAAVLVVYVGAEWIGDENGLLAVTAMGIVLANVENASLEDIRHFKEQISTLLVAFLFIVLSARLDLADLDALLGPPLLLIALILFAVRPLVVLVATLGSSLPLGERALIGWIAPRGVVAAAVAGAFEPALVHEGFEDASLLVPIVFGVILGSVVLHGVTLRPLARRLGLAARPGNGILLVGASDWVVALAQALVRAGAFVALADTRYRRVTRARLEGLEVHFGDVLSEETALEFPLERISWLLSTTTDDSYNALVSMNFARELGRNHVLQITPTPSPGGVKDKELQPHMTGLTPWRKRGTYRAIAECFWQGGQFKVTQTSESFTFEDLRAQNPGALLLFSVHEQRLGVLDQESSPPAGAKVVYLSTPEMLSEVDTPTAQVSEARDF